MIRVLLIDDEYYFRQSLKVLIDWQALGFEIIGESSNGEDALSKIPDADLVLLDVNIPKLNGLQVLEECVRQQYAAKIIIVTVYSEFDYIKKAIQFGAIDYLLKPLEKEDLLRVLEKAKRLIAQNSVGPLQLLKHCKGTFYSTSTKNPGLSINSNLRLELLLLMRTHNSASAQHLLEHLVKDQACSVEDIYFLMMEVISVCREFYNENIFPFLQEQPFQYESICTDAIQVLQNAQELSQIIVWIQTLVDKQIQLSAAYTNKNVKTTQLIDSVKEYIENNYTDCELSVASVASAFHMDYPYLSRLFNRQTGFGMNKFITQLRIQKAKAFLDNGYCSVQGIAEKVGFSDVDYFSKCFKKAYGLTPTQYADRNGNSSN